MRITLVVHQFPPNYFTGTEQYAFGVGKELQRRGHDVDVFTLEPAFDEASGPWRDICPTFGFSHFRIIIPVLPSSCDRLVV